jgi:hypothetical protein
VRTGPRVENIVPLGDTAIGRYAHALTDALEASGVPSSIEIAGSEHHAPGARSVAHLNADSPPIAADAYVSHDGTLPASTRGRAVFAPSHAIAAKLEEAGIGARLLPQAVSPVIWDGMRPSHDRWVDGKTVFLSIGPLGSDEAKRLIDTFVAYLGLARDARLLILTSDCDADANETLLRERSELDLRSEVVLVGDTPAERFTAYRAASVAIAVGRPLSIDAAIMPLWFDLPVVALADSTVLETIEACGVVADVFEVRRFAALLYVVVADPRMRAAMISEGRRVRTRHAPWNVAKTLLEQSAEHALVQTSIEQT